MTFSQIEALIDRYDAATSALDTAVTDRISASMDAAFRQMVQELERQYPTWQGQGSLFASQRRLLLLNELGPLLAIVRPEDAAEYERLMAEALQLSHTTGATLADELVRVRDPGYPLQDFATIPIEAAVAQARDGVGRLSRYSDEFRTAASGIVEVGLIQGFGTKKVQSLLEKELGVAKSKAETLARTEIHSALTTASEERYQRAGVEWVQVFLSPSESNCPFCVARNGNIYEVGQIAVPQHPRCRCFVAPTKRSWLERGLTDNEAVAKARTDAIAAFEMQGGRLNYGVTSWEKKAGLTTAPTPAWRPGDAVAAAGVAARAGAAVPAETPRYKGTPITVLRVENQLRTQRFESAAAYNTFGEQVFFKDGEESQVSFTWDETALIQNTIFTHNHPGGWGFEASNPESKGNSFSSDDWDMAATANFLEMRAVSPGYRHSVSRPASGWPTRVRMGAIYKTTDKAVRKKWQAKINEANKAGDQQALQALIAEANANHHHEVATKIAKKIGAQYEREEYTDTPWEEGQ